MVTTINEISAAPEVTDATTTPPETQKPEWLSAYTLRSPEAEIIQFVEAHPNLDFGLAFAPKLIALYFQDAPLELSMNCDPEVSSLDNLVIHIQTHLPILKALEVLETFQDAVWSDLYRFLKGKIILDVDTDSTE